MGCWCLLVGFVDPDRVGQCWWGGWLSDEAFGVELVGAVEHDLALVTHGFGVAVVNVEGGVEPDPGVTMLEVVPSEERLAVLRGVGEGPSLNGLSFDTWGRLWLLVTPSSASMNATGLATIGDPRSEWM